MTGSRDILRNLIEFILDFSNSNNMPDLLHVLPGDWQSEFKTIDPMKAI